VRQLRINQYVLMVLAIALLIGLVIKLFDSRFINPWTFVLAGLAGVAVGLTIKKLKR